MTQAELAARLRTAYQDHLDTCGQGAVSPTCDWAEHLAQAVLAPPPATTTLNRA